MLRGPCILFLHSLLGAQFVNESAYEPGGRKAGSQCHGPQAVVPPGDALSSCGPLSHLCVRLSKLGAAASEASTASSFL